MVNVAFDAPVDFAPRAQIEDAERQLYELAESGRYDGGFQRFAQALTVARRHGGQGLPARRQAVGHRHRPARPRHQDGRPAALRPDHRRRPSRHGQDRARHQHRLQRRQGASRRSPGRRHHEIRQWRHRRLLLLRNVRRTARHPYSRRADRHCLEHDPPRRHHRDRFREDPRLLDRTAVAAALCRRDRRPFDLAADRARAPAEAAKGPRPDRGRLHPAAAGLGQARQRQPRAGSHRDHHQPEGAGQGTQRSRSSRCRSCRVRSKAATTSARNCRTCANPARSNRTPTS